MVDTTLPSSLLGKQVSALQSDIVIGDSDITGTLKYVTGYTGFSGDPAEQSGNYIALHATAPEGATIKFQIIGGVHPNPVTLDEDGIVVARISNTNQKLKYIVEMDGYRTYTRTYSLSELTLNDS